MTNNIPSRSDAGQCVETQLIQACLQNQPAWEDQVIDWLSSDGAWLQRRCVSLLNCHALTDHLQHCIALVEADRASEPASDTSEQTADHVHSTLNRLTAINREIPELRYFHEQSIRQMAEKLNLTQSATKMRLYRAMDIFKMKFQNRVLP